MEKINEVLRQRKKNGLLRTLRPISCRAGQNIRSGNREYIDFSSNDYLGLSNHPALIDEIRNAAENWGASSCASRLLAGDLTLHHQLEAAVARWKNKSHALIFNSGYQANVGIISALFGAGDCIFLDRLSHASIIDGVILSGARYFRFDHNDTDHLAQLLEKERSKFKDAVIITETVFSMEGDKPPLKELVRLKKKHHCWMMVDEAHASGIFGKNGSGVVEENNLAGEIELIMGTFSKALAGFGAYLAADKRTIDFLINTCRSFMFSTALPPAVIAGNLKSMELVQKEPQRRKKLLENALFFRNSLVKMGLNTCGESQIVSLIIGEIKKTMKCAKELQGKGYWVLPVRPPTVPAGQSRLRFSLSYHHDSEILKRLLHDIGKLSL